MKLIADSGSTKTDWLLTETAAAQHACWQVQTQGMNPFHQSAETMAQVMDEAAHQLRAACGQGAVADEVYFYGSGCRPEVVPLMERLLRGAFPEARVVEVQGDLLGAARALCGQGEGIACILGTGANSCLYDGRTIVQNTPPLGYVLGDEGSGAVLGKRFVNALLKGFLPSALRDAFFAAYGVDEALIINKVYREPLANRFLASTSTFIAENLSCEPLRQLVVDNFRDFVRRNLVQYGRPELPVSAVGSVAWYYREQLVEALEAEHRVAGVVLKSPLEGLQAYHTGGAAA